MRKRVLPSPTNSDTSADDWLDLESLAEVEITSEDAAHPIESALIPGDGGGWRAAGPGEQTIRLTFDAPQRLRRIRLEFRVPEERTQEYVLRWSNGGEFHEVVRQQWNFSDGAMEQAEDHEVDLDGVTVVELTITPDISGGDSPASLTAFRLA